MTPTVVLSRRRLTLATAAQIGGRLIGALLGVVVAGTLARSLSRPAFGELALGLTVLGLAGSLTDLGMNTIAVREMARDPERRPQIAGALAAAQLITGTGPGPDRGRGRVRADAGSRGAADGHLPDGHAAAHGGHWADRRL